MARVEMDWLTDVPFAHRGLHDGNRSIPENSLVSFERAIQSRYPIELDIHLLADGRLAVFHDDTLDRMTSAKGPLSAQTAASLQKLTLADSGEKIPLLPEVLALVDDKVPLLIEIKSQGKPGPTESALWQLLQTYKGRYAIQSFNPFSVAWFASHAPQVARGQLSGGFKDEKMNFFIKMALQHFLFNFKSRPDFIAYDKASFPSSLVSRLRRKGLPVLAWTVRSQEEYHRAQSHCDNIIFELFTPT